MKTRVIFEHQPQRFVFVISRWPSKMALQFVYDLELRRYRDAVLAKWHTFYAGGLERNQPTHSRTCGERLCPWYIAVILIQKLYITMSHFTMYFICTSLFSHLKSRSVKATDMYDQAIRYVQELSLQEEIISWKSYRTGAWDYLLLASRNLVRVYVQLGTYYEPLQDLLPAAGMTHFEGIVPVNVRFCNIFVFVFCRTCVFLWRNKYSQLKKGTNNVWFLLLQESSLPLKLRICFWLSCHELASFIH